MRPSAEDVAEDLKAHVADCIQWRERVSEHLAEAKGQREEMGTDIKKLLAVFHHGRGFLKAVVWMGVVGSALIAASAWLIDHWHALWR